MKIRSLESKNEELHNKCDKNHEIILKFTKGQENWTNYYVHKELRLTKKALDIATLTKRKITKTSWLNQHLIKMIQEHAKLVVSLIHTHLKNHHTKLLRYGFLKELNHLT